MKKYKILVTEEQLKTIIGSLNFLGDLRARGSHISQRSEALKFYSLVEDLRKTKEEVEKSS